MKTYDVVAAYERLMGSNACAHDDLRPMMLQVLEREIRLDESQRVERLLRDCGGLAAALATLKMHIKALVR